MDVYSIFLEAIREKRIVKIVFDSYEKGRITRLCVPFDYGKSKRERNGNDKYHFFTIDSPSGGHNLSINPKQLVEIVIKEEGFDPADYVKWEPDWIIPRDWGIYS